MTGLNRRNNNYRGDISCKLCGAEREDQKHFILECRNLEHKRDKELIRNMEGENKVETLGNLLFKAKGDDLEALKEMLSKMLEMRKYFVLTEARAREGH